MRRYELIFILRPSLGEEEINTVIDYTSQIIAGEQGTIIELNRWGMKKLAYSIKKESQGYYVFVDYAGTPAAVMEIERKFRIDDAVMKYLTIKLADSISEDEIAAAIGESEARTAAQAAEEAEADGEEAGSDDNKESAKTDDN